MKSMPRFARLLPGVVVLGAGLLLLNGSDLIHGAYAQGAAGVQAALTNDPVPANADFAGNDDQIASASAVDVLGDMAKRRRDLDARQGKLDSQAAMISAAEARVDAKIAQLKQLQSQIAALLSQRDDAQKTQLASLVKTYSTMKPKDAARIFNTLPDDVLVPVAQQMKSDVLALILANMNSDNAQKLTVKLADKLSLPQTADALAPVAAPVQTAAVTPPPAVTPPQAAPTPAAPPPAPAHKKRVASAAPTPAPMAQAAPAIATPAATTPAAATPTTPAATPAATPKG